MACVRRRRGRWVIDFRDRDGTRRWESFRTRKEADDALSDRLRQLKRGSYRAPTELPAFAELAKDWLASKTDRRVSTFAQLQVHLDLHVVPALGHLRLDQITVKDIEQFRDNRRAAGLAPRTVNKLLTTIAGVFKHAQRHELTDRNPAIVAERCRRNAGELSIADPAGAAAEHTSTADPQEVLAPEQVARLIAETEAGFYRVFFLTAVLTGARVGELTALTWDDIDLTTGAVNIRRSVSWAKPRDEKGPARPRFYEPKTTSSRRTILVPPQLVSELRRWKLACPVNPMRLVFPSANGTPKHRATIAPEGLRPALRRARLPHVTIHSLRHTFASALIMQGHPVTQVAHLLGHSSPNVTLAIYAHWFKQVKSDAVGQLARLFFDESGSKVVAVGASDSDSRHVSAGKINAPAANRTRTTGSGDLCDILFTTGASVCS